MGRAKSPRTVLIESTRANKQAGCVAGGEGGEGGKLDRRGWARGGRGGGRRRGRREVYC